MRALRALLKALEYPHAIRWIVALGVLLVLPVLANGRVLDDHMQMLMATGSRGVPGLERAPWDLFSFMLPDADWQATSRAAGFLPWYADPELVVRFCRPLSSLLIVAEGRLGVPMWLAHAHHLAWHALLIVVTWATWRQLFVRHGGERFGGAVAPVVAAMTALVFAVDEGPAMTVGWLANRHATITMTIATFALHEHIRWRRGDAPGWMPPLLLAFAFAWGEVALTITAYLFAYAVWLDEGSWRRRISGLAPGFVVSVAWLGAYKATGWGVAGSSMYLDPFHDAVPYLVQLPSRLALLAGSAFSPLQADLPSMGPLVPPVLWTMLVAGIAAALIAGVAVLAGRHRLVGFAVTGAVIGALPVCAIFASDRNLLPMVLGTSGWIAMALVAGMRRVTGATSGVRARPVAEATSSMRAHPVAAATSSKWAPRWVAPLVVLTASLHLVAAPLLKPSRAIAPTVFEDLVAGAGASLDPMGDELEGRTLVLLHAPDFFLASYGVMAWRPATDRPRPDVLRTLHTGLGAVTVTRADDRTLVVETTTTFADGSLDRLTFAADFTFGQGNTLIVGDFVATIEAVEAGRPTRVRFVAPTSLDDDAYRFARFDLAAGGYVETPVPAVGASLSMPETRPAEFLDHVLRGSRFWPGD